MERKRREGEELIGGRGDVRRERGEGRRRRKGGEW